MHSLLTTYFLNLKLSVSLEEAVRLSTRILDLRNHGLEECPEFSLTLPSEYIPALKCILLQSNLLDCFSRANCHCLENLKALALDYNRLTDFPFEFRRLTNLTMLNVSHNSFHNLNFFYVICQLTNLKILWANATGIDEIPIEIAELTKLRVLGLRHNRISKLPRELLGLPHLRWLTLANNQISEIPPEICNLSSSLVHLNLGENILEKLPESFYLLLELRYLFLDHNRLFIDTYFKEFISSLPKLKYCSLRGNLTPFLPKPVLSIRKLGRNERMADNIDSANLSAVGISSSLNSPREENNNYSIEQRSQSSANNPSMSLSNREIRASPGSTFIFQTGENNGEWGDVRLAAGIENVSEIEQDENGQQASGESIDQRQQEHYFPKASASSSQQDTDQGQTIEIVFSRDEEKRSKERKQGEDNQYHETDWDDTASENIAEYDLPFANSLVTSVTDMRTSQEKIRSCVKPFPGDDENANVCRSSVQRSHRKERTVQWILHQDSSQPASCSLLDENMPESKSDNGNPSNLTPSCCCCSTITQNNSGENVLLQQLVKRQVNDLMEKAAKDICGCDNGNCQIVPSASSKSLIYIMPHARRDPQPYCLDASTSFTCHPPSTVYSSSVLITPSREDGIDRYEQQRFMDARDNSTGSQASVNNRTESAIFSVRETDVENQSSSILNISEDEGSIHYDPTDWEHSAPSSAIDDQEIVMRLTELQDEVVQDPEELQGVHQLIEQDWKRILPFLFIPY